MKNIYLPIDNFNDFACYVVQDKDTIRAYSKKPAYNSSSDYIDFYINSHYLKKSGTQSWGQSTYYGLPVCLPQDNITNDIYYRTDLVDCLIIFSLLALIMFWVPVKLTFFRLFRRLN